MFTRYNRYARQYRLEKNAGFVMFFQFYNIVSRPERQTRWGGGG